MSIDKTMLAYLVCPVSRTALEYNEDTNELISKEANIAFPVLDDIPIMLISEARQLD